MRADVSVVMPVWRPEPDQFREAVASVLRQTLSTFELIIVEDPSERPGAAIVRDFADSRIRYVQNPARTSIVQQHNHAVSLAAAPLVARFDADDVCDPSRLELQKKFLDEHPDIGVVGSQLLVIDSAGRELGERRYPTDPAEIRASFRRFNPIANPAVMFRKSVVEEFGGWSDGVNGVARDYEWYSRLAHRGVRFANLDERLLRYRLHSSSMKRAKLRETIRTTSDVKRDYWLSEMTITDRAVMVAERLLGSLPPSLVLALFRYARVSRPRRRNAAEGHGVGTGAKHE
ncbi:MAG TPA: glycosyltransferase [Thermoanaerobaculia bacterium]|nr:glycosyltransferase [Thermoanaerobaculia bacterium]